MRDLIKTVPNQLTTGRLVAIPVMWVLAWFKLPVYIGIGVLLAFGTDILDGYLARKLNQVSSIGAKLDSLADNLLIMSALIWLWLFKPTVYRENALICMVALTLYFSSILLGIIKFKRFANLHLYSSKIASIPMALFAGQTLIVDHYNPFFFYLTIGIFLISCIDTLTIQLISAEVNESMGSTLLVWQQRKAQRPDA
jgi:cardiolipin synthase